MIEVAVIVRCVSLHELGLGRSVRGSDVVRFAVVVPGDDFDIVGLELQQLHPAVDVNVGVLRVQPVGIAGHALEEPRGYACHPDLAVGGGGVAKGFVDGSFFGGGEGRMHPSEGTCTAVGEGGLVCADLAEGSGEEGDGDFDFVDNVGLPVPAGRVDFEGAEEDVAGSVFSLRRAVGIEVCNVDDLAYIVHGGGVDCYEYFKPHLCGGIVEGVESSGEVGRLVCIVDGEGVEARVLGQVDVGGIVIVWGWELDHVVGKDHGGGRALGEMRMGVRVSVTET